MCNIDEICLEGAQDCDTVGEDEICEGFGAWQEQTKAQRKLSVAATKAVKLWTNKALALAWGRLWGEVRRSRVVKKVALKWMQKAICEAWRMWETRVKEHRRQKGLLEKAAQRMRSAGIDKAWASWIDNATELRRQRRVLSTVTVRMRHACVYAAFASWVDMSKGHRRRWRANDVLRKTVLMMIHAALFKAWNRWLEHAMQVA